MFTNSNYDKYTDGLTDGQKVAFHKITEWFFDFYNTTYDKQKNRQVFTLSGYAGTGKSFLIGVLDNFFKEHFNNPFVVQASAYTGKAATVLSEKGLNSSTLHHMLYVPVVKKYVDQETDTLTKYVRWQRKSSLGDDIKLIIVDEVSMLPKKILEDLLTLKLPILAVGDGFQLPSIDTGTKLLDNPDYTLTEITRQAMDNSIIRLSMLIRNGGEIPYGDFGEHVQVINKNSLYAKDFIEIMTNYDQLLVGTNKTRLYYNNLYRRELLGEHFANNPLPCVDEKIIITQNNWDFNIDPAGEYNLFNGLIGTVTEVESTNIPELDKLKLKIEFGKKEYVTDWILYDTGIFRETLNNKVRFPYFDPDSAVMVDDKGNYVIKLESNEIWKLSEREKKEYVNILYNSADDDVKINQLDFAYAISVHKFQGSEADNVAVIDESWAFDRPENPDYKARWLYTAVTRAKKFLLLVR